MDNKIDDFAFITGASSGIGAVYADRFARKGTNLILVARSADKLAQVAGKIRATYGVEVEIVTADLNEKQELAKVEEILKTDKRISTLINNAGFGASATILESDVDRMQEMIELNVTALTRLTYAVVPQMVERGGGTIINISSIVAISPETLNGVYGGTKAFVLAFSQSLHHELASKGIRIQAVLPGATATNFWNITGVPVEHLPKEIVMTTEDMVDASLKGLEIGEIVTIPALPDQNEWNAYEQARKDMSTRLSRVKPAARYL